MLPYFLSHDKLLEILTKETVLRTRKMGAKRDKNTALSPNFNFT
jgi:hypothetical protein